MSDTKALELVIQFAKRHGMNFISLPVAIQAAAELAELHEYGNEWQRCAQAKDDQIADLRIINADIQKILDRAIAWHEGDDSPHARLEQELAQLRTVRDALSQEVDSLTEEVEKLGDSLSDAQKRVEEVKRICEPMNRSRIFSWPLSYEQYKEIRNEYAAWLAEEEK